MTGKGTPYCEHIEYNDKRDPADGLPDADVTINEIPVYSIYKPKREFLAVLKILEDLPFDLKTGEMAQNVGNRWLSWDPTRMVEKYSSNLKKLKLIYIDCGTKDELSLHWGARILHSKLEKMKVRHFYEEFDDGHTNISYRYDVSLPKIYSALSGKQIRSLFK